MFKVIKIQKRPSTDVLFFHEISDTSDEFKIYFKKKYVETKKWIKSDQSLSDDKLVHTGITYWKTHDDFLDFMNDEIVLNRLNITNNYNQKNNIVSEYKSDKPVVHIEGPDPYPNLVIPETWNSVEEFADWWLKAGMPMRFTSDAEVFLANDATSIVIFRKGRFQVELYLIHPQPIVPVHKHPDVEVIKMRMSNKHLPFLSATIQNEQFHNAEIRLETEDRGYPLISFQHWLTKDPTTTISSMWKNEPA